MPLSPTRPRATHTGEALTERLPNPKKLSSICDTTRPLQ
jgi:hypothetical protein